jgi:hypothetical protein
MSMSAKPREMEVQRSKQCHLGSGEGRDSGEERARDEDTRRRSYEIYLERAEPSGRELDDWLQAERELERGVLWQAG